MLNREKCVEGKLSRDVCVILDEGCRRCGWYHRCRKDEYVEVVKELEEMQALETV